MDCTVYDTFSNRGREPHLPEAASFKASIVGDDKSLTGYPIYCFQESRVVELLPPNEVVDSPRLHGFRVVHSCTQHLK